MTVNMIIGWLELSISSYPYYRDFIAPKTGSTIPHLAKFELCFDLQLTSMEL